MSLSDKAPPEPRRPLGLFSLFCLGLNGIVGVGIFFTPAAVAAHAPPGQSVAVFALTAALVGVVAYAFVRLGPRFRHDGGPIVYARAAFGPNAAFAVGWMAYVSAISSTAATVAGLAHALVRGALSPSGERVVGCALAALLALVCAGGVALSARVWNALTVAKIVPLLAIVVVAAVAAAPAAPPEVRASGGSWFGAALIAMFAFQGFEIVPVVAGQVRGARAVPIALVASIAVSTALYLALQAACVRALGGALEISNAPLADAARAYAGPGFGGAIAWTTSLSALGIAFAMMAMTPRYLSALAEGGVLGFGLARVNASGVPVRALVVTWVLTTLLVGVFGARLDELLTVSSVAVLCQYAAAALSLVSLGRRRLYGLSPRDALVGLPALAVAFALVAHGTPREWATAGLAIALGGVLRGASLLAKPPPRP